MSSTAGALEDSRRATMIAVGRDLSAAVWFVVLLLVGGLSLFLTWRRIAGALIQPPSGAAMVITAIGLASMAALLRRAAPRYAETERPNLLPGVVAILLLAAVTLPGTPIIGIAIAWFVLIASEATSWLSPRLNGQQRVEFLPAAEEPKIPEGLVQQVTRVRDGDCESIHAMLQAEVPAGDRLAVIHLAFCPPLAARPELTVHAMDNDDAEVRITQTEPFGARIEVRLPKAEVGHRSVLVEVLGSATCPPAA